jgi:DNA repair ATPase RecN
MSNKRIQIALALPRGADFYRCAFQVNPHLYRTRFRGQDSGGDGETHARALIDQAVALGISVLAITDHNSVSSIGLFRTAAEGRSVHIFPGFELSSSEGVHLLCIYPPETNVELLGRFLGDFGIHNTNPSPDLANAPFTAILKKVLRQGGIAVAAHATSKQGGMFEVLKGQARINAWQSRDLLAIQIPGRVDDLPLDVRRIVRNQNPNYRRKHIPEDDVAVAVVNAKDVVELEDLEDPFASCWIKMSEVSIEGLRQAFLDPGSRIRLNADLPSESTEEHGELLAMTWEGGFLDGAAVRFNPNLNVLVGGRGTGKSTVIESLRAVLGLEPIGDEARRAHRGIVEKVLKSGTKISLMVRSHRPVSRKYLIERTIPNPPLVRDDDNQVSSLTPQDVLPRVEVYSQHEISELTKSPEKLTRLLHRFALPDDTEQRRKSDLRRDLEKNRRSLIDAAKERREIEERLAELPGLQETSKKYREAGLEERLKEQSLLVREERLLESVPERLGPFRECLAVLRRELPIDLTFVSDKALEELPGKGILTRLNATFNILDEALARIAEDLKSALEAADQSAAQVRADWDARATQVREAYERILRELQKSRVDGEEFMRLRRRIEELQPLRERLDLVTRAEREHAERRRALLAEWEDAKAAAFRRLDRAAKKITRTLRNRVQVEVKASGNREPLLRVLREEVGGRLAEATAILEAFSDLSLTTFVKACQNGAEAVAGSFGIPSGQAERLAGAAAEVLMRIEELDLPATTTIRLNTALDEAAPVWQALDDLSTGQKATAVLLLLLLDSDAPLIVDQPEDDLDNRFISEGVVPRIREAKQKRQFVFSTHNANIPVLGDAELIAGMAAAGEAEEGHARFSARQMGSIDLEPVRILVEEILEGGKDAFELRRRRYGF